MLFNSYIFIFGFLPLTIAGFAFFGRAGRFPQILWLMIASLAFYSWWDWRFVGLLMLSIVFNFTMGMTISRTASLSPRKAILAFAVIANLALLSYFKYWHFLLPQVLGIETTSLAQPGNALPLGISFYTFTQIAFLVDSFRGEAREYRLANYTLFVSYFPHLIAGPLFHHKQMMPQFSDVQRKHLNLENISLGLTIFIIGLVKKVLIADNIAPYANAAFSHAANLTLVDSWMGVMAYTLQIYFDFSGYSDMAVGLSLIFNVRLPINFNSPYKAANIIDFWRRWHMTLSQFLRDYLYIPLGGNRNGKPFRYINLMITMLLGGLWHGAGWTFLIWGGLHGVYLVVNHAWRALAYKPSLPPWLSASLAVVLTFVSVEIAWVFFRADSLDNALAILKAMAGLNGIHVPPRWTNPAIENWLPIVSADMRTTFSGMPQVLWLFALLAVCWFLPNSQQLVGYSGDSAWRMHLWRFGDLVLRWQPTLIWGAAIGGLAIACVMKFDEPSRFLYYQF